MDLKEIRDCSLCHEAQCSKACPKMDPARLIRAAKFDNIETVLSVPHMPDGSSADELKKLSVSPCEGCDAPCEKACKRGVVIRDFVTKAYEARETFEPCPPYSEVDLSCDICGVKLENPFLLSSSVVASTYDMCARAFEMGWAGAAFKTICLMDIHEASPRFSALKDSSGEFAGFKNIEQLSDHSLEENMECFKRLKEKYPTKVIVASIMGRNEEEWEYLARKVTEAGADVIELNFSCPNMEEKGTGVDVGQNSAAVSKFTAAARRGSNLPILAKMTPNITDMCVPARAAIEAGADGIAAINTIKSITGVNIDTMVAMPSVRGYSSVGGYSGRAVKPIALRFISDMKNDTIVGNKHISGMGGIYTWRDAVEFLLLGAGSLQITTSVMEYGYRIIDDLISGLKHYMALRNIRSISEFIGAAGSSVVDTDELERDTVLFPSFDYDKCDGCGRCFLSCRDGGHQAIKFDEETRKPILCGKDCVGCHLCLLVCPNEAIGVSRKRISR